MQITQKNMSNTLGENISKYRREFGYTQQQLANKLKLKKGGQVLISKWEQGQVSPSLKKVIEMSKIFSVSIDEMI